MGSIVSLLSAWSLLEEVLWCSGATPLGPAPQAVGLSWGAQTPVCPLRSLVPALQI